MTQYRCYFITAANKAEESLVIEAASPQAAADEAMSRCTNPHFVSVEIWHGASCALMRRLSPCAPVIAARPPHRIGDV